MNHPGKSQKGEGTWEYALEADPGKLTASFPTWGTLDEALTAATAPVMSKAGLAPVRVLKRRRGPWVVADAGEPESFYSIRRTDGELIYGEYAWMSADGPDDWTIAIEGGDDEATEYEIVRMVVEPVAKRTLPECREAGCTVPAAFWGLCEPHAREDDPSAFEEPTNG